MVLYAEIKFEVKNLFPITLSPTDEEINMYDWKAYVKSFLTRFTQRQVCWNQNKICCQSLKTNFFIKVACRVPVTYLNE